MVTALINKDTKTVTLDDAGLAQLSAKELEEAKRATELVNRLTIELVQVNSDVPPMPNEVTKNISVNVANLVKSGMQSLQKNEPQAAIQQITKALDTASRRPLWEAIGLTLEEIGKLLAVRCDAYVVAKDWASAYADSSMSLILFPNDPMTYYRKAVVVTHVMKYDESRMLLEQALDMAPTNALIASKLQEVKNVIAGLNKPEAPNADLPGVVPAEQSTEAQESNAILEARDNTAINATASESNNSRLTPRKKKKGKK